MIANAQCADLLLPLFERARFAVRWKLSTAITEMQLFAVRANLLLGQQKGVFVPTQAGYQTRPFSAVKFAEITLQVIACVASRAATRTAMVLVDVLKRAEQRAGELAEVADQARSKGVTCGTA